MQNLIFILLITIPVAGYLAERYLDYLNSKMWSPELPEKLKDICDEEKYRKTQHYFKDNKKLAFWSSTLNVFLLLLMIFIGGFAFMDKIATRLSNNPVMITLIFFAIIGLAANIINIPFSYYDNFVIEKKYGFNTMSVRTFITDNIKSLIVAIVIGAPVISLITWFYYKTGRVLWIYAWIITICFTILINFFYSELIVPLFNKQTPLGEGPLRSEIEEFARIAGFHIKNIYVIDGSKRSTKANAYFSGFGQKKRIVLYDTLIKELDHDEIVAVLAHEIGHYRKKHIFQSIIISILFTGLMLFLFSIVINNPILSGALGAEKPSFHMGLIVFGILYSPISLIIGLITNYFSRKNEYQADAFVKHHNYAPMLASALKKLSVKNLSNMNPHPIYVFFHYSHPPLLSRLAKLERDSGS